MAGSGTAFVREPIRLDRPWRHQELLRALVVRNLKVKYQRSFLGAVWTLVNPLVTIAILVAVFSYVVRIPLENYWAFLLSGYFAWNFVIQTLNAGTFIFSEHSSLVRSAAFPPELLVVGAAITRLLEFGVAATLTLIAIVAFHHRAIPSSFLLLPLLIAMQLLMATGLAMPIALLSALYYDVKHALPIALTTLFYASPVFYPARMVPEGILPFYMLNPIAGLLTVYQQVVYEGRFPSPLLLGGTLAASAGIYVLGYALFNRYAAVYPEIV